jgi:hypothetical protein
MTPPLADLHPVFPIPEIPKMVLRNLRDWAASFGSVFIVNGGAGDHHRIAAGMRQ